MVTLTGNLVVSAGNVIYSTAFYLGMNVIVLRAVLSTRYQVMLWPCVFERHLETILEIFV